MSLIPWFDDSFMYHPSRYQPGLLQHPEYYLQAFLPSNLSTSFEELNNLRSAFQDTDTSVKFYGDKFQANIDVQQFAPEEISVKITGENTITVEAKHEEKQDEHGYISRHFVRKYVLPENCDVNQVKSKLSSDGVLTVMAPKVSEDQKFEHREIPITHTRHSGQPVRKVEQKENVARTQRSKNVFWYQGATI